MLMERMLSIEEDLIRNNLSSLSYPLQYYASFLASTAYSSVSLSLSLSFSHSLISLLSSSSSSPLSSIPILSLSGHGQGHQKITNGNRGGGGGGEDGSGDGGDDRQNNDDSNNGSNGRNGGGGSGGDDGDKENHHNNNNTNSSSQKKKKKKNNKKKNHSVIENGTSRNSAESEEEESDIDEDHLVTPSEEKELRELEVAKEEDKKKRLMGQLTKEEKIDQSLSHPSVSADSLKFTDPLSFRKLALPTNDPNSASAEAPPPNVGPLVLERWGGWAGCTDWPSLRVRSSSYLKSSIKMEAHSPIFQLEHVEIYSTNQLNLLHYSQRSDSYVNAWRKLHCPRSSSFSSSSLQSNPSETFPDSSPIPPNDPRRLLQPNDPSFLFIVHFIVSSDPFFHLLLYFRKKNNENDFDIKLSSEQEKLINNNIKLPTNNSSSLPSSDPNSIASSRAAFDRLFNRFIVSSDQSRNNRLKLLPWIASGGNWLVRRTVGNHPVIIGNKMTTVYYHNIEKNYIETCIDITSSSIGTKIFRVMKGYVKSLVVDMALLIEGKEEDELPERLIGGIRMAYIDFKNIADIDTKKAFVV